jgi:predicted TIM-barrel fold metal-dependent hydrolase
MFLIDYAYKDIDFAARWFEGSPIDPRIKSKVCWSNAELISRLS